MLYVYIYMITFFELFSTWIFIWFVIYYFKFISYSPKFWIIFITTYASLSILYMMYIQLNSNYICIIIVLTILSKLIPLYIIKNDSMIIKDILLGFLLGILYLLWLYYLNEDVFTIYFVYMFDYTNDCNPYKYLF